MKLTIEVKDKDLADTFMDDVGFSDEVESLLKNDSDIPPFTVKITEWSKLGNRGRDELGKSRMGGIRSRRGHRESLKSEPKFKKVLRLFNEEGK